MPEIHQGPGILGRFLRTFSSVDGPIAILGGSASFEVSGAAEQMADLLAEPKTSLVHVDGPLPTLNETRRIVYELSELNPGVVVGVGGGLVIDTMKLVAVGLSTPDRLRDISVLIDSPVADSVLMVAVPTTAGSGSERTQFAVVYVDGVKYSADHPSLKPRIAVVDPELTYSMPAPVAAACGLDVLAHSVESIWACGATSESVAIASSSLGVAAANLVGSVLEGSTGYRRAMSQAASDAGVAIGMTRTTAAHALSYYLTSFHNVPHGHAAALTLGGVLKYNSEVDAANVVDPRGADYVKQSVNRVCQLLGIDSPEAAIPHFKGLMEELGLRTSVTDFGLDEADLERWVLNVNPKRLGNNPRRMGREDLLAVARTAA